MSTFQAWAISRLRGEDDDDDNQTVRMTVRIDPGDYVQIQEFAKRLEVSKSRLIQQMISDCLNDLRIVESIRNDGEAGEALIMGGQPLPTDTSWAVDPFGSGTPPVAADAFEHPKPAAPDEEKESA